MRCVAQDSQLPTRPIDRVIAVVEGPDDQLEKMARRIEAAFLRRESQINSAASKRLAARLKVASAA
jgi:uncharacterized protein (DUF2384 family)